ncbi:hypothetical protein [Corynebacterium anserum]|uniref:Secreted protein n=1 Tax=Corynebacterium anserum TaxID=2684406 RepID=A0A7G7YPK6_9CORY|nr:hypothetical protein [Corynebacterium anserum]QNH96426.1 hypothetical protein GP473_06945 [Corynebacterium anserum]
MNRRTIAACLAMCMTMGVSACTIGDVENSRSGHGDATSSQDSASKDKGKKNDSNGPQPTTSDSASDKSKSQSDKGASKGELASLLVPGTSIAVDGVGEAGSVGIPAWSTSKVPVAIAALRHDPSNARYINAAISLSDNAAAEAMWSSMGEQAGPLTQAVLVEGGDRSTQVNTVVTRPGFTPFGQTQWALSDQVHFASQLRCIKGSETIVQAMGEASGQAYGLGTIPGAIFKGGWGPDPSGSYGVRQFGLVPAGDGYVAVAIAANSTDGSYEGGQAMLTKVAHKLQAQLDQFPQTQC